MFGNGAIFCEFNKMLTHMPDYSYDKGLEWRIYRPGGSAQIIPLQHIQLCILIRWRSWSRIGNLGFWRKCEQSATRMASVG